MNTATRQILHIIQAFSGGGAMRAALAAAKYSSELEPRYRHAILTLSPGIASPEGDLLCKEYGVTPVIPRSPADIPLAIEGADIVQPNWWNCPEMDALFRSDVPSCRLLGWLHVGGHTPPQIITEQLVKYLDFTVACSPYTYEAPAIQALSSDERSARTGMAYGAADFARVEGIAPTPHEGFNVGYIGTVHFLKMHPDYIEINAPLSIPNLKVVICGGGGAEDELKRQAAAHGMAERFEIRGYVEDIRAEISRFDVYGYLLCEDTYAAAEVNLQEVMYAGIPPVVFPYGGIRHLVRHNETGLVVHSPEDYRRAIEFLYNNPAERKRIGDNAARYAREVFGARNAARILNSYYDRLLDEPKRTREWGYDSRKERALQPPLPHSAATASGAERFIESMGSTTDACYDFLLSMLSEDLGEVLEAEIRIRNKSELMKSGGVLPYRRAYQTDPHLNLWSGLMLASEGKFPDALTCLTNALNLGLGHWRVVWYLAETASRAGERIIAANALQKVLELNPGYLPATTLLATLRTSPAN